jgi:AcrR family transcriptional regulator
VSPLSRKRDLILQAAIDFLLVNDESKMRTIDVTEPTGVSTSVIYTYFSSMQGLIDVALLEIYRRTCLEVLADFHTIHDALRNGNKLTDLLSAYFDNPSPGVIQRRKVRLRVAAATLERPRLRKEYIKERDAYLAQAVEICELLVREGYLPDSLSGSQWMFLVSSLWFSESADSDGHEKDWMAIISAMMKEK